MEVEGEPPEGAGVTCAKCGGPVSWRAMIDQRDAAMLARREAGDQYAEIGAAFGLSTDAVVHALRRHRHRLREATGEQRPVRAVDRARRERDRRIMTAADAGESQRVIGERERADPATGVASYHPPRAGQGTLRDVGRRSP